MYNPILKLKRKFKYLIRNLKSYWFVKTNTSKVSDILIKHDPCSLIYIKDNKIRNPFEYYSEAEALLDLINFYGGIKEINVNILHNLLYLVFIEQHIVLMNLLDGCPIIQSVEELEQSIGTRDKYLPIAQEIFDLINN